MEKKNDKYYYKKYDEIYGLIYTAKSLIENTKRNKSEITLEDLERIREFIVSGIDNIISDNEE